MKKQWVLASLLVLAAGLYSPTLAGPIPTSKCFGKQPTIAGRAQATLTGTSGPDVIVGGIKIDGKGGNDRICSLGGFDLINGGKGDDMIDGGDNQDSISGDDGNDVLYAQKGAIFSSGYSQQAGGETVSYASASGPVEVDLLAGSASGQGTDQLFGFSEIVGTPFGDTLRGGNAWNGNEIWGKGGNDVIYGSDHESDSGDYLLGGAGDDQIMGLGWYDTLWGQAGNDLLDGGAGDDSLNVGSTYGYPVDFTDYGADSYQGRDGNDRILSVDGVSGNDSIDGGNDSDDCSADSGDAVANCE